jgi:hypothetical protein
MNISAIAADVYYLRNNSIKALKSCNSKIELVSKCRDFYNLHLFDFNPTLWRNHRVTELNLSNNKLSGSIPSSIRYFTKINHYFYNFMIVDHNYFTFDGMEVIGGQFPDHSIYNHQKNIIIHQKGNALSVYAGGTLSNNTYKWFKVGGTAPILVATIKGDSVFHPAKSRRYRVKV